MVKLNPDWDKSDIEIFKRAITINDGYCPCSAMRIPEGKCMCDAFKKQIADGIQGECHCGLYVNIAEEE